MKKIFQKFFQNILQKMVKRYKVFAFQVEMRRQPPPPFLALELDPLIKNSIFYFFYQYLSPKITFFAGELFVWLILQIRSNYDKFFYPKIFTTCNFQQSIKFIRSFSYFNFAHTHTQTHTHTKEQRGEISNRLISICYVLLKISPFKFVSRLRNKTADHRVGDLFYAYIHLLNWANFCFPNNNTITSLASSGLQVGGIFFHFFDTWS